MTTTSLASVTMDCADPVPLAAFWAGMTGGEVTFSSPRFCAVETPALYLSAVAVDDYRPPTWPTGARPQYLHLDLTTPDLDAAEAEALALGAAKEPQQREPDRFRVYRDPAGHPFCLRKAG
ncbi:VOC family protein [Amycolatopsis jiangsuensis]|uniref:VOC domain-containing protein n=1 Tax=Amycolatopsis jiangsuensis TaxID=1181879 RepID=A0A840IJZ5_9PSEU|nr:VOC family protein [Amycolatopsis jiangsuensis]MBB4682596.1 hypothetical protein [Amycolatopsis jiangsuensis]